MKVEKCLDVVKRNGKTEGFTLIEVLLASALMGLIGIVISALYSSASGSFDETSERMLLDSHLRSRMEFLISTDFASINSGISGSASFHISKKLS